MSVTPPQKPGGTSRWIVFTAGAAIILIAILQTIFTEAHAPDKYTLGALLALALGGGVGQVADQLVKGYVQRQINATLPPAPGAPEPPSLEEAPDEAPA